MDSPKITVLAHPWQKSDSAPAHRVMTRQELKQEMLCGKLFQHLFRYREARFLVCGMDAVRRPFKAAILVWLLAYRNCYFEDMDGERQEITLSILLQLLWRLLQEYLRKPSLIRRSRCEIERLGAAPLLQERPRGALDVSARPVYLRTDLIFGQCAGGSIGHIAGVLNHLGEFTGQPVFLTTELIPTVNDTIETYSIAPENAYWDFVELPELFFNEVFEQEAHACLQGKRLAFIYQRYSLNNYSGVKLARSLGIPLVLEYNSSEIWIGRNWGAPLKYESLAEQIELLNLAAAHLVVVVSQALKDELTTRGIEAGKILVNPNGVDPERFHPGIDGSRIRQRYGLQGKTVVGFISSFGRWHGAEVLARAVKPVIEACGSAHVLFIGSGLMMREAQEIIAGDNAGSYVTFTGTVPQEEAPEYLAACDICVSPHIPNPDGTPFFYSPVKVFEYMAMGKGIVASDCGQMGEILRHGSTAWMVAPGDVDALVSGILSLTRDGGLRKRLGEAARGEVIGKYTWKAHIGRIIEKLKACCC